MQHECQGGLNILVKNKAVEISEYSNWKITALDSIFDKEQKKIIT